MRKFSLPIAAFLALPCVAAATAQTRPAAAVADTAIFAGGCFWCVEEVFDKTAGVLSTTSGYTGGHTRNPTYRQVSAGSTGHVEAVQVVYDPRRVGYAQLLEVFWRNVDPLTANRQFCDVGAQYRSAILFRNGEQRRLAEASKMELSRRFTRPVVTEVAPASRFYAAEEYHQDYHNRNPVRYRYYKYTCGRAQRLQEVWGG
jgi:peptide-methionine (S)-S-oxide reductase